jgi:tetratricopeptide (TPR) repeat protein
MKHDLRSSCRASCVCGACLIVALVAAPGCGTHGKFTSERVSTAKVRMAEMKSATEYQMAHQAFLSADLPKALRHIEYSLELNPAVVKSHILKGRILMEMNNLEASAIAFRRAEELDPKNVDAWYFQGLLAERLDRREEALRRYEGAARLDPTNPQYVVATAEMLVALDRVDEAEARLSSGAGQYEHSARVRQTLGHIALLKKQPERAATLFGEARLLAPDDPTILEDLAGAQIQCGKYAQAESTLAHLLTDKAYAERRDLVRLRAKCLMQVNRPAEARELLVRLTKANGANADFGIWADLGQVSFDLQDQARLKECAARCIAIDPNRPEGYVLRGLEQRMRADHDSAAASFAAACERERTPDNLVLLGLSMLDLGRTEDARSCFEAALKINPNHPFAAKLLASAR